MHTLLLIKYKKTVMKNSRQIQPPVSEIKLGQLSPVECVRLSNNIPLYLIEAGTEDIMRIEFIFKAGQIEEYLPLVASTTNMMLTEGSQNYTANELNSSLDTHGAFINLSADRDNAGLVIFLLSRHLRKITELCFEILFKPVFPGKELDILMKKRKKWFQISRQKVNNLSSDQFFESVFGKHHPYGRQISLKDFPLIHTSVLKDFHSTHYTPAGMAIIISGKIHPDTVDIMDKYFGLIIEKTIYVEPAESYIKGGEKTDNYKKAECSSVIPKDRIYDHKQVTSRLPRIKNSQCHSGRIFWLEAHEEHQGRQRIHLWNSFIGQLFSIGGV